MAYFERCVSRRIKTWGSSADSKSMYFEELNKLLLVVILFLIGIVGVL